LPSTRSGEAARLGGAGRGGDGDERAIGGEALAKACCSGGVGLDLHRRQVIAMDEAVGGADAAQVRMREFRQRAGGADLDLRAEEPGGLGRA
jgi:hypothetical protein